MYIYICMCVYVYIDTYIYTIYAQHHSDKVNKVSIFNVDETR